MRKIALTAVLFACVLCAQTPPASKPASVRFDINAIDRTADPCVDFYQYACGTWIKNNPIPNDQSRWGRFSELAERNREVLRDIEAVFIDLNRMNMCAIAAEQERRALV